MEFGSGTPVQREYHYDRTSRLVQEKAAGIDIIDFVYDALGNRVHTSRGANGTAYQYNAINELIRIGSSTAELNKTITAEGEVEGADVVLVNGTPADINGNHFRATVGLQGGLNTITAIAAKDDNQTIRRSNVFLVGAGEELDYDANGNLAKRVDESGGITTYSYDFENHLVEVRHNSELVASYTYDALGRRDSKTVGGETTKYVYDGFSMNVVMELTWDNSVKAIITRGPDMGGGIGGIVSVNRVGQEHYFHYNGRGDVIVLTDVSGQPVQTYQYDPFGCLIVSTGSIENPYRFSTKEYDAETGYYYFGARYYDPSLGRFITPDPMGYVNGLNQYAYALNNPLKFIDPLGLSAQNPIGGAICGKAYNNSGMQWYERLAAKSQNHLAQMTAARFNNELWLSRNMGKLTAAAYRSSTSQVYGAYLLYNAYVQNLNSMARWGTDTYYSSEKMAYAKTWSEFIEGSQGICKDIIVAGTFIAPVAGVISSNAAILSGASNKAPLRLYDHGFSIRSINPTGGMQNCVNCVVACDSTLSGSPACAMPGNPTQLSVIENIFGGQFAPMQSKAAIESELLQAGAGARGIVFGKSTPGMPGHVFNAVNQKGVVRFLDAQTGTPASFNGYSALEFLRTH
jgi:RHS repeat-associated protein